MTRLNKKLGVPLLGSMLVFHLLAAAPAALPQVARTLDRDEDMVVVNGARLPVFAGVPLNELFVYAFRGGQWHQIPWQFDEVRDGEYHAADNGLLDLADELVVMGRDCGDRSASGAWIDDVNSRSFPRCEIAVIDPLNTAHRGWIYLYRSSTLSDTVLTDYVDFNFPASLFSTPVYKLGLMIAYIAGDRLELNGSGVDILDRSKYSFKPAGQDAFNEEWAEGEDPQPEVLDGRVRAIAGYQAMGMGLLTIGYRSQFYDKITVDLSWSPVNLEWARASADFNEHIVPGTYYDANTPLGVPVDGIPDPVPEAPADLWQQISSATGTVIHTADVSLMQGTTTLYYRDSADIDPKDTGDKKSFGDMGVTVTHPIKYLYLSVTHYILPPNQPNLGAAYFSYFSHPLQVQVSHTTVEQTDSPETPQSFDLFAAWPNPFNTSTRMRYRVGADAGVMILLYDVSGRQIRTLVDERQIPGSYEVLWDGLNAAGQPAASAVYLCVMRAGSFSQTRRLLLIK